MSDSNDELLVLFPVPGENVPEDDEGILRLEVPGGGRSPEAEGVGSCDVTGVCDICWVWLGDLNIPLTSRDVMSMLSRLEMELRGLEAMNVRAAAWSSRTDWVWPGDDSDWGRAGDGRGSSLS